MSDQQTIQPESHQHWLELRAQDLTSTEVSALFGLSPYLGAFELWHRKRNRQVVRIEETERMRWGNRLEASIAQGAAEERGWTVQPHKAYVRLPQLRLGSSFDFLITAPTKALLEVKNVDGAVYAKNWIERDGAAAEAPEHIELQVQHQLLVADLPEAYLVALVGGNSLKILHRKRDDQVCTAIRAKAQQFWASIEAGVEPAPDFRADGDYIRNVLRRHADDGTVLHADIETDQLLQRYRNASAAVSEAEGLRDAIKAEVLLRIGAASKVVGSAGTLSCSEVPDSPGKLVTPELVGTYINARKGYRSFRFTPRKEK